MALTPMCLRLEAPDGSTVEEFRVSNGQIDTRQIRQPNERHSEPDGEWRQLTPEELSEHVRRNTAVSQWLKHRLGWRRLLRACTPDATLHCFGIAEDFEGRRAA